MNNEYSLWIMPDTSTGKKLQDAINLLSKKHGTPAFAPHLTLLGRINTDELTAIEKSAQVAGRMTRFIVKYSGVSYSNEYFKCVFLKVSKEMGIMTANRLAAEIFSMQTLFAPHVSLMYGDMPMRKREEIARRLEKERISFGEFCAESIRLYMTSGKPADWELIEEYELAQSATSMNSKC